MRLGGEPESDNFEDVTGQSGGASVLVAAAAGAGSAA